MRASLRVADIETGSGRPAQAGSDRQICVIDEVLEMTTPEAGGWTAGGRDPLLDSALGPALLQAVAGAGLVGATRSGRNSIQQDSTEAAWRRRSRVGPCRPQTLRIYRPRRRWRSAGGIARPQVSGPRRMRRRLPRFAGAARAGWSSRRLPRRCVVSGSCWGRHLQRTRYVRSGTDQAEVRRVRRVADRGAAGGGRRCPAGAGSGEYCPGEFSINDGRGHKLVGTAQRLVRGGWLFGTVILVTDPEPVRDVLVPVYDALELPWDPQTVGAVQSSAPGVTVDDVHAAVRAAYEAWVSSSRPSCRLMSSNSRDQGPVGTCCRRADPAAPLSWAARAGGALIVVG